MNLNDETNVIINVLFEWRPVVHNYFQNSLTFIAQNAYVRSQN